MIHLLFGLSEGAAPAISLGGAAQASATAVADLSVSRGPLQSNAAWTWFTDPRAVHYNGSTYFGWVNSSGDVGVTKYTPATGASSSFTLRAALETDDHNNAAIYVRSDGRIVCFYSKHGDAAPRYRVSSSTEDISAFAAEVVMTGVSAVTTYVNPRRMSDGKCYLFYRGKAGGTHPTLCVKSIADSADWQTAANWSAETRIHNNSTGAVVTPYWKLSEVVSDKVQVVCTDKHPVDGQSSLYHFEIRLSGGSLVYYKADGTQITASLPLQPANIERIYDGSVSQRAWVVQAHTQADGRPCGLWAKYPSDNGTDIRIMDARYNGASWDLTEVVASGSEQYTSSWYPGGADYDAADSNRAVVSVRTGTPLRREIQEWVRSASGTWAKNCDVTQASAADNSKPVTPRNYDNRVGILYLNGSYTSFLTYALDVRGAAMNLIMSASAQASATAAAALTTSQPISGAVSGVATAAAALDTEIYLSSNATAVGFATGALVGGTAAVLPQIDAWTVRGAARDWTVRSRALH